MENVLTLRKSFRLSIFFHGIIFAALLITLMFSPPARPPVTLNLQQSDKILQAVSVNQDQVDREISALKNQQQKNQAAMQAKLTALQQQAAAAAKLKQQQEQALAALKAQQQAAVKQQQDALAKLQQQQQSAQKQLQATQQQAKQQANAQKQLQMAAKSSMQQELNQDATQLNQAKQQQVNSELAKYTELIRQAISQQWIIPANTNRQASCILEIKLAPGGVVSDVQVKQSSGDDILDRSAITAVYKASPLPVPTDPALFKLMQDIQLKVQPDI